VMAGQVLVHLHGVARGHRGGKRIDNQQDLHAIARYLGPIRHLTQVTARGEPSWRADSLPPWCSGNNEGHENRRMRQTNS
jgi:hypothetical protein